MTRPEAQRAVQDAMRQVDLSWTNNGVNVSSATVRIEDAASGKFDVMLFNAGAQRSQFVAAIKRNLGDALGTITVRP